MTTHCKIVAASAALAGALALGGLSAATPIFAAEPRGAAPGAQSALQLTVDKPIIHLGERILLSGRHYTPGATVRVYLHGPFVATLGPVRDTLRADRQGHFALRLPIDRYPDSQARLWRTITVAAASSARVNGMEEGAAVSLQADPMPSAQIVTHGRLKGTFMSIDGNAVTGWVTPRDATHYTVGYAGHLRPGLHNAYLKWVDVAGFHGYQQWDFRIGSPSFAGPGANGTQLLTLDRPRIRVGQSVLVSGRQWTPGATVTLALGGPNAAPATVVGRVIVDAAGRFALRVRVAAYPDANARTSGTVIVAASATGAMVGDLPEGFAAMLAVVR